MQHCDGERDAALHCEVGRGEPWLFKYDRISV